MGALRAGGQKLKDPSNGYCSACPDRRIAGSPDHVSTEGNMDTVRRSSDAQEVPHDDGLVWLFADQASAFKRPSRPWVRMPLRTVVTAVAWSAMYVSSRFFSVTCQLVLRRLAAII
jgi:hypothetical protein